MIHEPVDIERWKALFPIEMLREEIRQLVPQWFERDHGRPPRDYSEIADWVEMALPHTDSITGPLHVAMLVQEREELREQVPFRNPLPTDVFVLGKGEPARRDVTKTGGLPCWPRERPWPRTAAGEPMTFIAQFNFFDSLDITGPLPGELLLLFGDQTVPNGGYHDDPAAFAFHWLPAGLDDLIAAADVPETAWTLAPYYGEILRTVDYTYPEDHFEQWFRARVFEIEGIKIGGRPYWVQNPEFPDDRFLCVLGSNEAALNRPFAYVNTPEPLLPASTHFWPSDKSAVIWGDSGSLYIFLTADGKIRWSEQCY